MELGFGCVVAGFAGLEQTLNRVVVKPVPERPSRYTVDNSYVDLEN
jgi:hypothetical protein